MNEYSLIETRKLEKIHYTQLKIIKEREISGQIEGITFDIDFIRKSPGFLRDIFREADKTLKDSSGDLLGLHYYVMVLKKLPLEKVKEMEIQVKKELKKRREIIRQRLDTGNIDKVVKQEVRQDGID